MSFSGVLKRIELVCLAGLCLGCIACAQAGQQDPQARSWLAGDHHVHSRYSVGWDVQQDPPAPIVGGEGIHSIPLNAQMASRYGLAWMAVTDHGGPYHSKVNLQQAYPELQQSRREVPGLVQFYAMELNSPGADHSSLIIPRSGEEAQQLYDLESRFDRKEAYPPDPARDSRSRMLEALRYMAGFLHKPIVIANHPARSARGLGEYGLDTPSTFRDWNDSAPDVAVGMAGAPGHQAMALGRDGSPTRLERRGGYERYPTMGSFDQMTARLGGLWDALLGEGRRWWITANSDSHVHFSEGGGDFWPGEYSKTYVWAARDYDDILAGIRAGHMFVTTGDLISELYVSAEWGGKSAGIGEELVVPPGADVKVTIRFRDPDSRNHHGDNPSVSRVDLILGEVTGRALDHESDTNPSTRVLERFSPGRWRAIGAYRVVEYTLEDLRGPVYLRVRGTGGKEPEPEPDTPGEDPWLDLWFYSNPVFVTLRSMQP
jgi:hypothetical protein